MPEAVVLLQTGESGGMSLQQIQDFTILRMADGQHIKHLTHREDGPAVGPAPMEGGMRIHLLYPAVTEQSLLRYPHPLGELEHLPGSLVEILPVTCQNTHIGNRRNTHEHVIEPNGILLWTDAGESTVDKAELLVHDIVGIVVYQWSDISYRILVTSHQCSLDHRAADGSGIVEGMRVDDATDIHVDSLVLSIDFPEHRGYIGEQLMTLCHIIEIGIVTSGLVSGKDTRIGYTPLITCQSEAALLQLSVGIGFLQILHLLTGLLVDQHCRSLSIDVSQYDIHRLLHLLWG